MMHWIFTNLAVLLACFAQVLLGQGTSADQLFDRAMRPQASPAHLESTALGKIVAQPRASLSPVPFTYRASAVSAQGYRHGFQLVQSPTLRGRQRPSFSSTFRFRPLESSTRVYAQSKEFDFVSQKGSASIIRNVTVLNALETILQLNRPMGNGTSIVICLRHIGAPEVWSYVKDWSRSKVKNELKAAGITGPVFVTIGNAEKINVFVDRNPWVSRYALFADRSNYEGYDALGLRTESDVTDEEKANVKVPWMNLDFGDYLEWAYSLDSVGPISAGRILTGDVVPSMLRLGGVFVVSGDDVVYQYRERKPGDMPDIAEVLAAAKDAAR